MRNQIEELFGEAKDFMGLRRMRLRRLERVREQPLLIALALASELVGFLMRVISPFSAAC